MASVEKSVRNGRVTWLARWRDPGGTARKKSFQRRLDAERHLIGVRSSLLSGSYVDPVAGRITVAEYAKGWLINRQHLKLKTRVGYESLLSTRVLPRWGATQLSRVDYAEVAAWVSNMSREGLSASRTRQSYHLLKSILDDAVKESRLMRNPALGVQLPQMAITERRYLTHNQVFDLAEACGEYGALINVLAYGGLRWGEATALRAGRVDADRGRLEVVEAVTDVNGVMIFGSPKTHQHRSVPIPSFLREDLASAVSNKADAELVFTSPSGMVLRATNFRRRTFDAAAGSIGLAGLTPHELRHTAASLAIAVGATVKGVQLMLGHASATLTLDRYGHLFEGELDAVADRLEQARTKALVPPVCHRAAPSVSDAARASL
jgi:integrase